MPKYVDFYVYPVPKPNLVLCLRICRVLGKIWRDHGALEFTDVVADDVKPGKWTSYPRALKLKKNEVVVIEYVVFKSRRDHDRIIKDVLKDPRFVPYMDKEKNPLPFDGRRVIKGGFKVIVSV